MLAATSTAAAQTATPANTIAPAAKAEEPAPLEDTGCISSDRERTTQLFGRAIAAWEQGDTVGAVAAMRDAHAVSKCSAFLFVLGEMLSQSEHECDALVWYERYISDNPAVEKRSLAVERIAQLRSRCPASAPPAEAPMSAQTADKAPAPPASSAPSASSAPPDTAPTSPISSPGPAAGSRYWSPARIGGWASLGVSALLGTGAVYFAVRARNASDDYEQLWKSAVRDPAYGEEWQRRRAELEQRGSSSQTTARILGGAAGALALGGALLVLFNPADQSPHQVAVSAQPSGMMARYGVRF